MDDYAQAGENYEVGRVLSRSFAAIRSNFLLFATFAVVFAGIPIAAISWWQIRLMLDGQAILLPGTSAYFIQLAVVLSVSLVSSAALQPILVHATIESLSGRKPSFAASLATLKSILPVIAIGLVFWLAEIVLFLIGIVLLALAAFAAGAPAMLVPAMLIASVPPAFVWVHWAVVVPAYVEEEGGVVDCFGRSNRLTKGARVKVFLTLLIVWSVTLGFLYGTGLTLNGAMLDTAWLMPRTIIAGLTRALASILVMSVGAAIYFELREAKEGSAPDELEAIFV